MPSYPTNLPAMMALLRFVNTADVNLPTEFPPPMDKIFFPERELKMGRLSANALVTSAYPLNAILKLMLAGDLEVDDHVQSYQPLY